MKLDSLLEWTANLLGVFDVDLDSDFEDDGYTDYWGLAPVMEPACQDNRRRLDPPPVIAIAPVSRQRTS